MEEKLVSYKVAKLAKEVGFNEECEYGYTRLKELMTIDRSQESFFGGASRNYRNSELESYNKSYLECNDDEYVCIYTAPTQSFLQKWLREVHNIEISVRAIKWENDKLKTGLVLDSYEYEMYPLNKPYYIYHKVSGFKTYEQALEQAILESLKLIKNEKI